MFEFEGEQYMTLEEFKKFFYETKEEAKKDFRKKVDKIDKLKNKIYA